MTHIVPTSVFTNTSTLGFPIASKVEHGERRCVVTGIGIATPVASKLDEFCDFVESGGDGFDEVSRFDVSWCASKLACSFDMSAHRRQASSFLKSWMDRAAWYVLDALDRAIEDSGVNLRDYDKERIAVVLGTSHSGVETEEALFAAEVAGTLGATDPRCIIGALTDHVSSVVAAKIGARGIRRTVTAACASSTGAMGIAADLINYDQADIVISGGSDTVSLSVMAGFNTLKALAEGGCRPFSTDIGITLGEGAGVLILERLDGALERKATIRAEIIGYAMSGDAHHATAPDESGDGIRRVIEAAIGDAGLLPDQIDYVSAHGTGTEANDIAESRGTSAVFGTRTPVSSTKSIIGHTLGASGVIETALTLGLGERGKLPPTQRFQGVRPGCIEMDYVPNSARAARTDVFICNNYGFGGSNASVVFRRSLSRTASPALPASARRRRVAISGVGVLNARNAFGAAGLIETLAEADAYPSESCLVPDPRLPPHLKRAIGRVSPCIKYAVSATGDAVEAAGLDPALCEKTGLVFAAVTGPMRSSEKYFESVFTESPIYASANHFAYTNNNSIAGQVSIHHGLKGYNTTLAGPAGALGYSISLVENGRQARVIAGGADEHTQILEHVCAHVGLLAEGRPRPFQTGSGLRLGEGAASIVFEHVDVALARGHRPMAELLAFGEAHDGNLARPSPRGDALRRSIARALKAAELTISDIDMIVANGTGPRRFVAAETSALEAVFGQNRPNTVSLVRNVGTGPSHTPIAIVAAAAALVAADALPPSLAARPPRIVLAIAIDLTGVSCAALVGKMDDGR